MIPAGRAAPREAPERGGIRWRAVRPLIMPTPPPLNAARTDRTLFTLVLAAFLVYTALFIYRTSFVVAGARYFSLFDDAMVSMRYARNLAHGYGLVWNPGGARVEGFTNPLWVLDMAIVHLLPIPWSKTSLVIQTTAAILLALNLYYVRRIALAISNGSRSVAWGAIALTASYLPINMWSLQGMEVSVLVPLTTICVWLAIQCLDTGTFQPRLYVLLGIGTWIRPDMAVPFVAVLSFMLMADPRHRHRHLAWGVIVLAIACAAQTMLRLWYYGDVLPNTFYLKMTGVPVTVRVSRGLYVLLQFVWKANPLLFALPGVLALRRDRRVWALWWVLIGQMAYSVYVGGDAWEYWGGSNRYICIAMPGFFILLSYALRELTSAIIDVVRTGRPPIVSAPQRASTWTFALIVAYAIVSVNSIHGPGALAEALLIRPTLNAGPGGENQRDVEHALLLRDATTPQATLAVVRAGTIPYFADRYTIDLLGKNDKYVARGAVHMPSAAMRFMEFRPGHMKTDLAYSIGRLRPDVIVQLRKRTDEAKPFMGDDYEDRFLNGDCVHLRRGSPHVWWSRLPAPGCGP
jgi:hypothetical protein